MWRKNMLTLDDILALHPHQMIPGTSITRSSMRGHSLQPRVSGFTDAEDVRTLEKSNIFWKYENIVYRNTLFELQEYNTKRIWFDSAPAIINDMSTFVDITHPRLREIDFGFDFSPLSSTQPKPLQHLTNDLRTLLLKGDGMSSIEYFNELCDIIDNHKNLNYE